jgi:hypothetical protein
MTAAQAAVKKKSRHAAERAPERVQTLRVTFRATVQECEVHHLQCVEASGATRAMPRRFGRATPGQRVAARVPAHYGTTPSRLAALSLDGLDAPWGVAGAVHGALLHGGVSAVLGPTLRPGDRGLGEHRSAQKVAGVEERWATRDARLLRLSPSAPAFHPSAQCWSKITTVLRRAKARTVEALLDAIKEALDTVTAADRRGGFEHCGYPVH